MTARSTARFFADLPLLPGTSVTLPDSTARHVQVLRLQPGDHITLFNGQGYGADGDELIREGEFDATVTRMGRSDVDVTIGGFTPTHREATRAIHLAVVMPANERMDWLVEKATELGAVSIQPLMSERSVLRLKSERADKKVAHWRGIAIAACEQCGRNRLPVIHDVRTLADWLKALSPLPADAQEARLLLSLQTGSRPLSSELSPERSLTFLSGPEGGLSPAEEAAAMACGFAPVTLGPRVLRAETAPLVCLSLLGLSV
jgi:16S rRNA (uracil1498-N3)-methyltransferase